MNEKVLEAFNALCSLAGVKRIVFVDDRYATANDRFVDFFGFCIELKTFEHDPTEGVEELAGVDFAQSDDDLRDALRAIWTGFDEFTKNRVFSHLQNRARPEEETNAVALNVMRELCRDIEYYALSLADWREQKDNLLRTADEVGTFFLFDEDLSREEGGREDEGIDLLAETLRRTDALCALISYKFTPEQERERWTALGEDGRIDQNRCVPIAKAHLQGDPMSFVRRVKFTALQAPCRQLQNDAAQTLRESFQVALDEIKAINLYDFEHIVFHASRTEGIWEPDTLFRLFGVFQRHAAREILKNDDALNTLVTNIRAISQIPHTVNDIPAPLHDSWRIQRRELYENAEYLNRYHLPLELGDIFLRPNGGAQFILLAQSCDLMLREDQKGERRPGATEVMLARVVKDRPKHPSDGYEELPYYDADTGESSYVDFRKAEAVKLSVLDLCVYQIDGSATLKLGDTAPERIIPVWRMHYDALVKDFEKVIAKYKTLLDALPNDASQARSVAQSMMVPPSSNQNLFKGKIQPEQNRINYDVQRIGRLNHPRAAALYNRFAQYSSRAAFEMDFGREQ